MGRHARTVRAAAASAGAALAFTAFSAFPAAADERHRVEPGDTVSGLAHQYGSSVSAIVNANDLNTRALIVVGQTLTIPTTTPPPAAVTHRVASGDTLWDIARAYGTTVGAIVEANSLRSASVIRVGTVLRIPGATSAPASGASPTAQSAATTAAPSSAVHTVRIGDTLWDLARSYGTTVGAIVESNSLRSASVIRVGQRLTIPGATATPTSSTTSASPTLATPSNISTFGGSTSTYTVALGDSVSAIAARFGTTVSAIASANNLANPSVIRVGQRLTVPGGTTSGLVGDTFLGRTYAPQVVASANQNKATLNAMDVPSRAQMQAMVVRISKEMGVDPALAQAIAYQESGFNMRAVSPANAIGVMQVIPTSGEWASTLVGRNLNLLVPEDNVTAGVAILRALQRNGTSLDIAIAGYYQGEAGVRKYGMNPDTVRYVASVKALMKRYS